MRVLRRFFNRYFARDKVFVRSLRNVLGFTPAHVRFYQRAFTHKSSLSSEDGHPSESNERLEYLGDAILGAIIADYLFRKYPSKDEGFMTKMRSKVVNRRIMNDVADQMGLRFFLTHCGAQHISRTMLGNALEAFIGAVYLDVGYTQTKRFVIRRILQQYIDVHVLEKINYNFKSQLLEHSQKQQLSVEYTLIDRFKQNNRERFKVGVLVDQKQLAQAEDFSKKSAEQEASKRALLKLGVISKEDIQRIEQSAP